MKNGISVAPPDLPTVLKKAKLDVLQTLNCVKIGVIQSFDAVKRTAEVQIMFSRALAVPIVDRDGKTTRVVEYPLLKDCPVVTLQGGGGSLTFPVKKGDECLVLFSDSNIDAWYEQGSARPSVPYDGRRHDISDGIALVGLNSLPNPLSPAVTADEVSLDFSGAKIAEKNGKIHLGNATQNFITVMDTFLTAVAADSALNPATKTAATNLKTALDLLFY